MIATLCVVTCCGNLELDDLSVEFGVTVQTFCKTIYMQR